MDLHETLNGVVIHWCMTSGISEILFTCCHSPRAMIRDYKALSRSLGGPVPCFRWGMLHKWKPRFPLPNQISRKPPDNRGYQTTALEDKPYRSTISKLPPMKFISPAKLHTAAPARQKNPTTEGLAAVHWLIY